MTSAVLREDGVGENARSKDAPGCTGAYILLASQPGSSTTIRTTCLARVEPQTGVCEGKR